MCFLILSNVFSYLFNLLNLFSLWGFQWKFSVLFVGKCV
uniref:Uncharacterized protein n=1 Tax=Rhizophora mucronata TaxID=61149 RepID=A0A2P2LMI4_RHIMU